MKRNVPSSSRSCEPQGDGEGTIGSWLELNERKCSYLIAPLLRSCTGKQVLLALQITITRCQEAKYQARRVERRSSM